MNKDTIIELKSVKKTYDGRTNVIEDFNLEIKEGEFVTFLGPSGCGKTTILRMIGGFDTQTSGEIFLDGNDISPLPPNKRPINTVFQKYALFPHLNVYDNVAFGLKMKKTEKAVMDEKVKNALEIVDLEGFEKRNINTLSGGQQQRIAIARAIVNEPRVLLLDEPLSALDYKMRKEMQIELKNMHKKLGITFIFVTHDQEEALTMSDKVVVLADGKVQQVGTPEEIYNEPSNVFVADFIGESNIFNGKMLEDKKAEFAGTVFQTVDDYPMGIKIDAVIRPEDIDIVKFGEGQINGTVISADFKGTFYVTFIQCDQYEIEVHCFEHYNEGDKVGLNIPPDMIHIIKYDTSLNHYNGRITDLSEKNGFRVEFANIAINVPVDKVYGQIVRDTEGNLIYKDGTDCKWQNAEVLVYFDPADAKMSDDVKEGIVSGSIASFYYIGDHYSYTIRTASDDVFVADDEYLWNQGDMVSIIVPEEKINVVLKSKAGEK